jgi:hypothetical protein
VPRSCTEIRALSHDGVVSHDFSPGYPTDRRSEQRRRHVAEGPVGDFEGMAARVVARLTGERVVIQDDGSKPAMPDIRIDYSAKPPAYIEAVVDVATPYAAMAAEIWKQEPLPADLIWTVHITGRAPRLAQLRHRLPQILGGLHHPPEAGLIEELASLGLRVTGPWEPPPGESGKIHLRPEGAFGNMELLWESLLDWIAEFLASDRTKDVRRKLAATAATERHAFIGVSFTSPGDAYHALRREGRPQLPTLPPRLPPEITHLWVWSVPGLGRCLAWFPDRGWLDVMVHWATP